MSNLGQKRPVFMHSPTYRHEPIQRARSFGASVAIFLGQHAEIISQCTCRGQPPSGAARCQSRPGYAQQLSTIVSGMRPLLNFDHYRHRQ